MFLKQEEWFLNQLKTEIREHLLGHPQTDQQSLKKKVKYHFLYFDTSIQQTSIHSQDYINLCTSNSMWVFPFLGFKSNKYQHLSSFTGGMWATHSFSSPAWKQKVASQRFSLYILKELQLLYSSKTTTSTRCKVTFNSDIYAKLLQKSSLKCLSPLSF